MFTYFTGLYFVLLKQVGKGIVANYQRLNCVKTAAMLQQVFFAVVTSKVKAVLQFFTFPVSQGGRRLPQSWSVGDV